MRKIVINYKKEFPTPVHEGSSSVWHLYKVLQWFKSNKRYDVEDLLLEITDTTMQINVASQMKDVNPKLHLNLQSILA